MQIDDRCGRREKANGVTGRDIIEAGNGRGEGDAGNIWRWGSKTPVPDTSSRKRDQGEWRSVERLPLRRERAGFLACSSSCRR